MVPQYMIDNSDIFGDIEVSQNLFEKRSLLMTPFFIFDDVINKVVSGQQIMHQSRDPVNYLIDRHISQWILLIQISTACHVWNLRY